MSIGRRKLNREAMRDRCAGPSCFPDIPVSHLRQLRQVTRTSLFAFISNLCPNRQVAGGALEGPAGDSGLDEDTAGPTAGTLPTPGTAAEPGDTTGPGETTAIPGDTAAPGIA